jgi:hypothetical protein
MKIKLTSGDRDEMLRYLHLMLAIVIGVTLAIALCVTMIRFLKNHWLQELSPEKQSQSVVHDIIVVHRSVSVKDTTSAVDTVIVHRSVFVKDTIFVVDTVIRSAQK